MSRWIADSSAAESISVPAKKKPRGLSRAAIFQQRTVRSELDGCAGPVEAPDGVVGTHIGVRIHSNARVVQRRLLVERVVDTDLELGIDRLGVVAEVEVVIRDCTDRQERAIAERTVCITLPT